MIVVTGGAGFIGSHLVKRLIEDGADVLVLDNLRRGSVHAVHPDARLQCVDICNMNELQNAMEGAQTVFHLAAQSNVIGSSSDPKQCFHSNVVGTYNVLSAAKHCGARRLIFTSSREVYGQVESFPVPESALISPKNTYGTSKVAGELYCHDFGQLGLEFVILRLANVYGAGDSGRVIPIFFDRAMRNEPLTIYGSGKLLDFVHVDTVVDALVAASRKPVSGQTLNVGTGKGTTLEELARKIINVTGSQSEIEYKEGRSIEVDRYVADIEKGQEALGYLTAGPLDEWQEAAAQTNSLVKLSAAIHKHLGQPVSIGVETLEEQMAFALMKHK